MCFSKDATERIQFKKSGYFKLPVLVTVFRYQIEINIALYSSSDFLTHGNRHFTIKKNFNHRTEQQILYDSIKK